MNEAAKETMASDANPAKPFKLSAANMAVEDAHENVQAALEQLDLARDAIDDVYRILLSETALEENASLAYAAACAALYRARTSLRQIDVETSAKQLSITAAGLRKLKSEKTRARAKPQVEGASSPEGGP